MDRHYLGLNNDQKIYRYSPNTDSWVQETDFPGSSRSGAIASVSNNKAYFGLGGTLSDFWEFQPAVINNTYEEKNLIRLTLSPNPTMNKFSVLETELINEFEKLLVFNSQGELVRRFNLKLAEKEFDISMLPSGVYTLVLNNSKTQSYAGRIILSK